MYIIFIKQGNHYIWDSSHLFYEHAIIALQGLSDEGKDVHMRFSTKNISTPPGFLIERELDDYGKHIVSMVNQ